MRRVSRLTGTLAVAGLVVSVACYDPTYVEGGQCGAEGQCPNGQGCVAGVCRIGGPANVAFVTADPIPAGDVGGVEGADSACQSEADAAGLAGEYRAFLATNGEDPIARLAGSRGWVRPDDLPVVDTPEDLASGRVWHPILMTAGRVKLTGGPPVWTGANADGTADTEFSTCANWTESSSDVAAVGFADLTRSFARAGTRMCDQPAHLLCFGVGQNVTVEPVATEGRLVFVTATPASILSMTTEYNGVGVADTLCAADASTAGFDGEFRALISTVTFPPSSRFERSDEPIVRSDGVVVAETYEEFIGDQFATSMNVTASGDYVNGMVWSGVSGLEDTCAFDRCCAEWSFNFSNTFAPFGLANSATRALNARMAGCGSMARVYCLERVSP